MNMPPTNIYAKNHSNAAGGGGGAGAGGLSGASNTNSSSVLLPPIVAGGGQGQGSSRGGPKVGGGGVGATNNVGGMGAAGQNVAGAAGAGGSNANALLSQKKRKKYRMSVGQGATSGAPTPQLSEQPKLQALGTKSGVGGGQEYKADSGRGGAQQPRNPPSVHR